MTTAVASGDEGTDRACFCFCFSLKAVREDSRKKQGCENICEKEGEKIKNKHTSVAPVSDDTLLQREPDLKPQKLLTVDTSVFTFCRFLNHPVRTL